ncbi:ribosome biogenesis protein TSR3 isoform X1 [Aphis craccivora]|uniref:Ribosome biogenesis protein TSR3 isoform X1 n=1 Tax=Aphis craccivora TaxID=307492 RepID=A0A6G0ZKN5_APHCR|nr:ribosome biogenesis protein TSR3 isoform X1 [Aphis craccivora]
MWEFDKEVNTLFIDFEKAYDSIHRLTLFNILKEFNIPRKQGDALSPILFNLVLEKMVRDMSISEGITLGLSKIGLQAYADDIAIIGDNIEIVKIHCKKLMDATN